MAAGPGPLPGGPVRVPARDKPGLEAVEVLAARVPARNASRSLRELQALAPLPALGHAKRIRPAPAAASARAGRPLVEVLLCSAAPAPGLGWPAGTAAAAAARGDDAGGDGGLPPELRPELAAWAAGAEAAEVVRARVPRHAPVTREDCAAWSAVWPLTFRLPEGEWGAWAGPSAADRAAMAGHLRRALALAEEGRARGHTRNAAVIVDPETAREVAAGHDETGAHPLRHAVRVALDAAAAQQLRARKRKAAGAAIDPAEPYMCTGYDCYTVHEPCAMCAMALVHSRVKRVVFLHKDAERGMLGGSFRLHSLQGQHLNHHYEVYHWDEGAEMGNAGDGAGGGGGGGGP